MNAIRIHTQLDSTTLILPALASLVGKNVEIIVREEGSATLLSRPAFATGDWTAFDRAVEELRGSFDFDAVEEQDRFDREDSERTSRLWQ